jgi:hypothetical protein
MVAAYEAAEVELLGHSALGLGSGRVENGELETGGKAEQGGSGFMVRARRAERRGIAMEADEYSRTDPFVGTRLKCVSAPKIQRP